MVDGFSTRDPFKRRETIGGKLAREKLKKTFRTGPTTRSGGGGISARRETSAERRAREARAAKALAEAKARAAAEVKAKAAAAQKARQKAAQEKAREARVRKSRTELLKRERILRERGVEIKRQQFREAGVLTGDVGKKLKGLERIGVVTRRTAEELVKKQKEGKKLTKKEKAIELGFQFAIPLQESVLSLKAMPSAVVSLVKNPENIKEIPRNIATSIKQSVVEVKELAKVSPSSAVARIGGDIVLIVAGTKGLKVVGKLGGKAATKVNPFLKRVKNGKLTIRTSGGKTVLTTGSAVKKIAEPISKQASIAGKKVTAVSAQADRLVNFVKTKRIIRKPVPGEAKLASSTKKLLSKFDEGTITKRELIDLQSKVPVLERSFFADPKGRFRPSRLGIQPQKDASIIDIIKGDFTFKTQKPQILVFENVQVSKFPKALKDVEKALKAGRSINKAQSKRLLDWQSKKTGKFKPVGALTKEPEITLAPGEIIKKVKKRGTTVIDGKKVDITEVKIVKPKPTTKKLLNKAKEGAITNKELKDLTSKLKSETGFESSLSKGKIGKPKVRLPKRPTVPRKPTPRKPVPRKPVPRKPVPRKPVPRKPTPRKPVPRKPTPRKPVPRKPTPRKPVPRKPTPRKPTPRRPTPRKPLIRSTTKPPVTPPIKRPTEIRKKKPIKKPVQVFDVFGKSKGKFVKLNVKPLTRADALSKGAFAIDRTTARTFKIAPKGKSKTPGALLKGERNYFKRQGFKLREVRIKKGRKFQLKQKYIEKSKHAIDTRSEKSGLTIAKHIQQQRKKSTLTPTKARKILKDKKIRGRPLTPAQRRLFAARANTKKPKRRITPAQRKELLKRLEKARAAKRKLKGGKRK